MKFDVKGLTAPITRAAYKAGFKVRKHSPEILLTAGLITGGVACVTACKATLKANDILDEYAAAKDKINQAKEIAMKENKPELYSEEDQKKDQLIATRDLVKNMIILYAPSAALGALSTAFILSSYGIMRNRNTALIAAYTALEGRFRRLNDRIAEKFGEDVKKELNSGVKVKKGVVEEKDDDGNDVVNERDVPTMDKTMMEDPSNYGRLFSKLTSTQYQDGDPVYNQAFLRSQEAYFNDLLQTRGYVFLSEVYRALGFELTPESVIVGWIKNSALGDSYVSFGLPAAEVYRETGEHVLKSGRIVKTLSGKDYFLDFNVDGVIWNLI